MSRMKLGRRPRRVDRRTLQLNKYVAGLPAPVLPIDYTKGQASWGMMDNDVLGDCTCAGVGHAVQVFSLNGDVELSITDAEVLAIYETWCGYVDGDPSTDNGGVCLDVLNDWRKQGFAGTSLPVFCAVDVTNQLLLQQAVACFFGLYIGFEVPNYIMDSVPQLWDLPQPGQDTSIDGGHCVFVCGVRLDPVHGIVFKFISWGAVYEMTWGFFADNCDEAYALVNTALFNAAGLDPQDVDLSLLEADLADIELGAIVPGHTAQFTVTVTPAAAKVDATKVQVTVTGLLDNSAVLSSDGLVVTVNVASTIAVGTECSVTWVYGTVSATATFTVGAA